MTDVCPVCRAATVSRLPGYEWSFDGVTYYLHECGNCRSVATVPLPSDETLKRLYARSFDYRWYRDHFTAKLKDSNIRLAEYKKLLRGRILDFGGGLGYLSQAARDAGYQSETFDPYADPASRIPSTDRWDTVIALHVLEHANNLDRICTQIKGRIEPGGLLILAVPNYVGLGYRSLGMRWVWAQPPLIHVHHFTPAGLKTLLERHGFTEIDITFHERWDANRHCDVDGVGLSRWFDTAWGTRPFSRFKIYRRLVAAFNTWRRFRGLAKSPGRGDRNNADLAELQVTARLPEETCGSR